MPNYQEMTVDELREEAKKQEIGGIWDMRKEELVDVLESFGDGNGKSGGGNGSSGRGTKEITSVDEGADHDGQTLVTRNHEVIKKWAEERDAKPATVPGTEHGDHLGVLRFDFAGYGGDDLEEVSWDDWFRTFDERNLKFKYQERLKNGNQSNFFRLDNPDREDG